MQTRLKYYLGLLILFALWGSINGCSCSQKAEDKASPTQNKVFKSNASNNTPQNWITSSQKLPSSQDKTPLLQNTALPKVLTSTNSFPTQSTVPSYQNKDNSHTNTDSPQGENKIPTPLTQENNSYSGSGVLSGSSSNYANNTIPTASNNTVNPNNFFNSMASSSFGPTRNLGTGNNNTGSTSYTSPNTSSNSNNTNNSPGSITSNNTPNTNGNKNSQNTFSSSNSIQSSPSNILTQGKTSSVSSSAEPIYQSKSYALTANSAPSGDKQDSSTPPNAEYYKISPDSGNNYASNQPTGTVTSPTDHQILGCKALVLATISFEGENNVSPEMEAIYPVYKFFMSTFPTRANIKFTNTGRDNLCGNNQNCESRTVRLIDFGSIQVPIPPPQTDSSVIGQCQNTEAAYVLWDKLRKWDVSDIRFTTINFWDFKIDANQQINLDNIPISDKRLYLAILMPPENTPLFPFVKSNMSGSWDPADSAEWNQFKNFITNIPVHNILRAFRSELYIPFYLPSFKPTQK